MSRELEIDVDVLESRHSALLFVGDLTWPAQRTPTVLLEPDLRASAALVPNLEGPVLDGGRDWRLRSGATCGVWNGSSALDALAAMETELVGGANNHATDFRDGLQSTAGELERRGIALGGVGESREAACRPVLVSLSDGGRVLVLFIGDRRVGCIPPRRGRPGVNVMSERESRVAIEKLRVDFPDAIIIASVHAGEELQLYPAPYVRTWFRKLATAGADVVIGHHPHVRHGAEKVGASWIFYSLGNFLMGAQEYVGVRVGYPESANASLGVLVGGDRVAAVRFTADPEGGSVRQVGDVVAPELLGGDDLETGTGLDEESYSAWYRERRTVAWWYPLWTGRESALAASTKTCWLRAVTLARRIVFRLRAPGRAARAVRLSPR